MPISIYDPSLSTELQAYTYNLCEKLHERLNIPLDDILSVTKPCNCAAMTVKGSPCGRASVPGSTFCKTHGKTKKPKVELEYVSLHGQPYLYDPITRNVYAFGSKSLSKVIGKLNDELSDIIV